MSSLLAVFAAAVGASVAGMHAICPRDRTAERFDRWIAAVIAAAATLSAVT